MSIKNQLLKKRYHKFIDAKKTSKKYSEKKNDVGFTLEQVLLRNGKYLQKKRQTFL